MLRRSVPIVLGAATMLLVGCGDGEPTGGSGPGTDDAATTIAADTASTSGDTEPPGDSTIVTDTDAAGESATADPTSPDDASTDPTRGDSTTVDSTTDDGASGAPVCALEDLTFEHQVIDDSGPVDPWQKIVGDLNGDGRVDLIAGGEADGGLVWYESPDWTRHEIAPGGGHSTDGEVADVDGDDDLDVVSITRSGLVWYANPSWEPVEIDSRDLHDVEVADFDGDGDVDAVARDQGAFGGSGDELHFYEQESATSWTRHAVSIPNGEGLLVADIDADGDDDVVIGGSWYENTGDIADGPWTEHEYTSSWIHPNAFVAAGDLNGDGRLDVVLAPAELAGERYRIAWYAAPADPASGDDWAEHVIEDDVEAVHHFVGATDFDNDGDIDVAAAEMDQGADPDEVKIFVNDAAGESWAKVVLATDGSHSMRIVDADGNGFADLFGANYQGSDIELWLNPGCA